MLKKDFYVKARYKNMIDLNNQQEIQDGREVLFENDKFIVCRFLNLTSYAYYVDDYTNWDIDNFHILYRQNCKEDNGIHRPIVIIDKENNKFYRGKYIELLNLQDYSYKFFDYDNNYVSIDDIHLTSDVKEFLHSYNIFDSEFIIKFLNTDFEINEQVGEYDARINTNPYCHEVGQVDENIYSILNWTIHGYYVFNNKTKKVLNIKPFDAVASSYHDGWLAVIVEDKLNFINDNGDYHFDRVILDENDTTDIDDMYPEDYEE